MKVHILDPDAKQNPSKPVSPLTAPTWPKVSLCQTKLREVNLTLVVQSTTFVIVVVSNEKAEEWKFDISCSKHHSCYRHYQQLQRQLKLSLQRRAAQPVWRSNHPIWYPIFDCHTTAIEKVIFRKMTDLRFVPSEQLILDHTELPHLQPHRWKNKVQFPRPV